MMITTIEVLHIVAVGFVTTPSSELLAYVEEMAIHLSHVLLKYRV